MDPTTHFKTKGAKANSRSYVSQKDRPKSWAGYDESVVGKIGADGRPVTSNHGRRVRPGQTKPLPQKDRRPKSWGGDWVKRYTSRTCR